MKREKNPFIVSGKIKPEFFCDRVQESAKLIKAMENGNNLVLISPRRMGKTGLIHFCYDKPEIRDNYYTFFIDILHTTSLREFTYILGRKIYDSILPRSKKMLMSFVQTLKSVSGRFGFDPVNNTPTFNLELGDIYQPELTLDEIFLYLEQAGKPCIIAIDEFQQIANYPEKNIEAILRTHIQRLPNCHFIFAGSEYHIMQEMFISAARPFYNSADIMELKAIDKNEYVRFVNKHMLANNRHIDDSLICSVYELYRGNTYAMQRTFNEAFALTEEDSDCTKEILVTAINNIIESREPFFQELLSSISEKHKPLLYSIAMDGEVEQITSAKFINSHKLSSASNVQHSAKQLLERGVITRIKNRYYITEPFFALWINMLYGKASFHLFG